MAFARASSIKIKINQDVESTHLNFKVKCVFLPNNLHSIMYHENDVQSPIRTYLIIALHEHQAIFHVLQLYSINQIPFFYFRCCSITCHFLVNN